ncbi:type II toxin-antitoxin system HicB family antitoxin [Thioalkalivibrio sp. ALJ24]|uniref:type II toxin-antitoxin system HicB family antitoxin n=1 Tax=Thioalkalivibrio sp. ALJ24 TaxID=545276 RepID=UPI0003675402|nr:type II toxin-antitoxin system HicB family antitoxin [Thioalkalivibrio sp. ALJ24]
MKQYTVIIQQGDGGWGAYVPDLPGCIATGDSREEVMAAIREAITMHLEALHDEGEPIPEPHHSSETVRIDAA